MAKLREARAIPQEFTPPDGTQANQYNALGKSNIDAIGRIVQLKYQRGVAFNRQHPFVDVLLADIIENGEALDIHANPPKDYLA
jgi:hypothetical protein